MKNVCVITGGGSGMGLATAKILGKDQHIIIVGRTLDKLEAALEELKADGIEAESFACDISDRSSVDKLVAHAKSLGKITCVIHAAGMSPQMGSSQKIMEVNALGTIIMNEAFYQVMEEDSCILNVSSMSGYFLPNFMIPKKAYRYSRIDTNLFMKKIMSFVNLFPKKLRNGISYSLSKNFVIWYVQTDAVKFGKKGIRLLSVSPGSILTPMGELEKGDAEAFLEKSALARPGRVEEVSELMAFLVSDKASYMTGIDILCDGGVVASRVRA